MFCLNGLSRCFSLTLLIIIAKVLVANDLILLFFGVVVVVVVDEREAGHGLQCPIIVRHSARRELVQVPTRGQTHSL